MMVFTQKTTFKLSTINICQTKGCGLVKHSPSCWFWFSDSWQFCTTTYARAISFHIAPFRPFCSINIVCVWKIQRERIWVALWRLHVKDAWRRVVAVSSDGIAWKKIAWKNTYSCHITSLNTRHSTNLNQPYTLKTVWVKSHPNWVDQLIQHWLKKAASQCECIYQAHWVDHFDYLINWNELF